MIFLEHGIELEPHGIWSSKFYATTPYILLSSKMMPNRGLVGHFLGMVV